MYDLVILGGGPAGLTAAIYAARYGMKPLLLTAMTGGYLNDIHLIENYPGFKEIHGMDLTEKMKEQVDALKIEIKEEEVKEVIKNDTFIIKTDKNKYEATSIILAIGTMRKKLGIKGEDEFLGTGVSYCATCDGPLYRNKTVAIVGGANSACDAALLLSEYADKVYLIHRSEMKAPELAIEKVKENEKIELVKADVKEIKGSDFVEKVITGEKAIDVQGVFIEIGSTPATAITKPLNLKLDSTEHIITDSEMKTNIQGCFAAGDIISKKLRQIVTACADGACAALSAYIYARRK